MARHQTSRGPGKLPPLDGPAQNRPTGNCGKRILIFVDFNCRTDKYHTGVVQ